MKHTLLPLTLGLIMAIYVGNDALAKKGDDTEPREQEVVIDFRGNPLHSTSGDCVVTKWKLPYKAHNICYHEPETTKIVPITEEFRTAEHPIPSFEPRTYRLPFVIVHFPFDSTELTADAQMILNRLVKQVRNSGKVLGGKISGYTDSIGSDSYNKELSRKRAERVIRYLKHKGVDTSNIDVENKGKKYSVTKCNQSLPRKVLIACLAKDRQVEVEIEVRKDRMQ